MTISFMTASTVVDLVQESPSGLRRCVYHLGVVSLHLCTAAVVHHEDVSLWLILHRIQQSILMTLPRNAIEERDGETVLTLSPPLSFPTAGGNVDASDPTSTGRGRSGEPP